MERQHGIVLTLVRTVRLSDRVMMIRIARYTRAAAIAVTLLVVAALVVPDAVPASRAEADRLREQLNDINADLRRAGERFDEAFWALDETEKAIQDATDRIAANEQELDEAQEVLQGRMAAWYRSDELGFITFLLGAQDFTDLVTRMEYASRVALNDSEAIDRVETLLTELREDRERLEVEQAEHTARVEELESERDRLDSQMREKRAEYDRVQRELAEAARREEEARQRAAAASSRAAVPPPSTGSNVTAAPGPNGMVFPVAGPNYYSDTWGASRGGGRRRHQGTDIMATTGTPAVATLSGTVTSRSGSTAGLYVVLRADNGWTFYYMHLDAITVGSGRVQAGQQIGTVGYTGNASASAPHLHYEIHPPGRGPVNPYPYLLQMQGR